jgi:hypothetical protein
VTADTRRILAAQALRALAYGFGSVLLGVTLAARGWSSAQVGLLLAAIVAGTALTQILVGTLGDRIGRRRTYAALFCCLALAGLAFGLTTRWWLLVGVALTGALSTEVVESGPFTSLEQAMLPQGLPAPVRTSACSWCSCRSGWPARCSRDRCRGGSRSRSTARAVGPLPRRGRRSAAPAAGCCAGSQSPRTRPPSPVRDRLMKSPG